MFAVNQFIESCKGQSPSAVKELLEEALRDPEGVKQAMAATGKDKHAGSGSINDLVLFASQDLTVLQAAVPPKFKSLPHNHTMWAVIGVYDGQENNTFYRRSGNGLEQAGDRQLRTGNVLVLGVDAIHAIENPLDRVLHAIHVYGGDLPKAQRSMWNPFTQTEEPFEYQKMLQHLRQLKEQ